MPTWSANSTSPFSAFAVARIGGHVSSSQVRTASGFRSTARLSGHWNACSPPDSTWCSRTRRPRGRPVSASRPPALHQCGHCPQPQRFLRRRRQLPRVSHQFTHAAFNDSERSPFRINSEPRKSPAKQKNQFPNPHPGRATGPFGSLIICTAITEGSSISAISPGGATNRTAFLRNMPAAESGDFARPRIAKIIPSKELSPR